MYVKISYIIFISECDEVFIKMERETIDKCLKYFGLLIFISSSVELIIAILISLIPLKINLENLNFINYVLSENFPITGRISWILTIITPILFMLLGFLLYYIIFKKKINIEYLSKYMIVFGLILLIGTFIKLEYQYILQKQVVFIDSNNIFFIEVLINPISTPFLLLILWTIQTSIYCGYTVLAIVITAGGLNKSLKIEREQEVKI